MPPVVPAYDDARLLCAVVSAAGVNKVLVP